MENDEITEELELEIQDESVEESGTDEESIDSLNEPETTEQDSDTNILNEYNKFQRLATKRGLIKPQQKKPEAVKPKESSKTSPSTSVDERILKAQGMPEALLEELKVIASLRGVDLIDAQTDHLFVATKEKYERDSKARTASLGASRGSGQPKVQTSLDTPELSREEHKKLALEAMKGL